MSGRPHGTWLTVEYVDDYATSKLFPGFQGFTQFQLPLTSRSLPDRVDSVDSFSLELGLEWTEYTQKSRDRGQGCRCKWRQSQVSSKPSTPHTPPLSRPGSEGPSSTQGPWSKRFLCLYIHWFRSQQARESLSWDTVTLYPCFHPTPPSLLTTSHHSKALSTLPLWPPSSLTSALPHFTHNGWNSLGSRWAQAPLAWKMARLLEADLVPLPVSPCAPYPAHRPLHFPYTSGSLLG
jgi:hypothetical protein